MPGGKANIESAYPPSNLEPNITSITKLHEPQEEA